MEKPIIIVDLQGSEGNVFALMVKARAAMIAAVPRGGNSTQRRWKREAAQVEVARMMKAVMQAHSYDEALDAIGEYVTIQSERRPPGVSIPVPYAGGKAAFENPVQAAVDKIATKKEQTTHTLS